MTLPDERYRAVLEAEEFLRALSFSETTKRIPLAIRQRARGILRHYPNAWDLDRASQGAPEVFQPRMEDVTRIFKYWDQKKAQDEA
jgi:hypothetical protein